MPGFTTLGDFEGQLAIDPEDRKKQINSQDESCRWTSTNQRVYSYIGVEVNDTMSCRLRRLYVHQLAAIRDYIGPHNRTDGTRSVNTVYRSVVAQYFVYSEIHV